MGCVEITGHWAEKTFFISLKENNVFEKLFESSFGSNIIAWFTEFKSQGTDTFGFIWVQTFEIHIQAIFYINIAWILL